MEGSQHLVYFTFIFLLSQIMVVFYALLNTIFFKKPLKKIIKIPVTIVVSLFIIYGIWNTNLLNNYLSVSYTLAGLLGSSSIGYLLTIRNKKISIHAIVFNLFFGAIAVFLFMILLSLILDVIA
jgi:hypothetical protein